jgi:Ca2+-binding RTX toxin-like protein
VSGRTVGAAALVAVAVLTLVAAFAATNAVPATKLGRSLTSRVPTANELKPPACAALNLTDWISGSGTVNAAGNGDTLVLGSAGVDNLRAKNGNDCLVGGAGADTLNGGSGNDVCIGGAGINTFIGCETQL